MNANFVLMQGIIRLMILNLYSFRVIVGLGFKGWACKTYFFSLFLYQIVQFQLTRILCSRDMAPHLRKRTWALKHWCASHCFYFAGWILGAIIVAWITDFIIHDFVLVGDVSQTYPFLRFYCSSIMEQWRICPWLHKVCLVHLKIGPRID